MKLQTGVKGEVSDDIKTFLKEHYPEKYAILENWSELDIKLSAEKIGNDEYLVILEVPDEEFLKLEGIFPTKDEAMGAFYTMALESGWEEFPSRYVIYHAQFEEDKLIAGIKTENGISKHEQTNLEPMIQTMARYPRVIVYSGEVLTYIKDLYPEVDSKTYVIAREIAKVAGNAPDLEDLGKIYGIDTSSLEGKLELIEKLLNNPVKTPSGEINIRPYYYPLER